MIPLWEHVALNHRVELLALETFNDSILTHLPVTMFPIITEMPGFMRDLDRYVQGSDLIVGIETSRLATFQALRSARKFGIKFSCIVHEFSPFVYEKFVNIRAIQHDLYTHSDRFFATSKKSEQLLQLEGVPAKRITRMPFVLQGSNFVFSTAKRDKFRNYIGIPSDSLLILINSSLHDLEPALTILQGARLAMNRLSAGLRSRLRFLVCGDGQQQTKLKYEVSDMGLGAKTMFLAQDTKPFLCDMLAATDVLIEGRWPRKNEPEPIPFDAMAAAVSGVRVVLPRGTIAEELLAGVACRKLDDFAPIDIAQELVSVLDSVLSFEERVDVSEANAGAFAPGVAADSFLKAISDDCPKEEQVQRKNGLSTFIRKNQIPVTYKDAMDVLVKCEELRDFASTCESEQLSEIYRIRGDALVALSRAEDALISFEQSLKINQANVHALRGLGYLAWYGHSHEDAIGFFKRGLALNPNDYQCLTGVGLVYRRLKMFEESVFWLHKAVAVGGPESPSMNILVQACLENPESPEAMTTLLNLVDSLGDLPNLRNAITRLESQQ
jgi:tetratricopeptide (TPR) repeat protein